MALDALPTELLLTTYSHLHSLNDAFNLSRTCRRLKAVLIHYADDIYTNLAPRSIPCEKHARAFHERHSGVQRPFSIRDIKIIIRGSEVVDQAVLQFERDIVSRYLTPYQYVEYYAAHTDDGHRPKTLTRSERRRFIRTYYLLLHLRQLPDSLWKSASKSLSLKQHYLVADLSRIDHIISDETVCSISPSLVYCRWERKRGALKDIVRNISLRDREWKGWGGGINGVRWPWDGFSECANEGGWEGYVVIWDHWQEQLKNVCHGVGEGDTVRLGRDEGGTLVRLGRDGEGTCGHGEGALWDESEDEE